MRILFVCKYNRFRSRVAEAYFKKRCKNKNIVVESAGIIGGRYPLSRGQVKAAKKLKIDIRGLPKGLSIELLKKVDFIVIVADDVPKKIFQFGKRYLQKIEVWKIPDGKTGGEIKENIKIIRMIIKKVDELVKELENKE